MDIEDLLEIAFEHEIELDEEETYESLYERVGHLIREEEFFEEYLPPVHVFAEVMDPIKYHVTKFLTPGEFVKLCKVDVKLSKMIHDCGVWKSLVKRDFNTDCFEYDPKKFYLILFNCSLQSKAMAKILSKNK